MGLGIERKKEAYFRLVDVLTQSQRLRLRQEVVESQDGLRNTLNCVQDMTDRLGELWVWNGKWRGVERMKETIVPT